jgi:DNA-binding phage protein
MAVKALSDQLREAVRRCGKSRYRISQETGITQAQLSRFVNGHADLALATIDKLIECLGLKIKIDNKASSKKRNTKQQ